MEPNRRAMFLIPIDDYAAVHRGSAFDLQKLGFYGLCEFILMCSVPLADWGVTAQIQVSNSGTGLWDPFATFEPVGDYLGGGLQTLKISVEGLPKRYVRVVLIVTGSGAEPMGVLLIGPNKLVTGLSDIVLGPSGASAPFGFSHVVERPFEPIEFRKVTNNAVSRVAGLFGTTGMTGDAPADSGGNVQYGVLTYDVNDGWIYPLDWHVSDKKMDRFTFNGIPGREYSFLVGAGRSLALAPTGPTGGGGYSASRPDGGTASANPTGPTGA